MLQPLVFAKGEVGARKCKGAAGDAPLSPSSTREDFNYMATQLCGPRHARGKQNVPVL